jgi:hypothetical protein
MAHELAHSWFGNLVTMPWWDDLWLNESFATWMAHRVVHEIHPEYQQDLALLQQVHSAMNADSLDSARSIRQPIASDHDIANAFDGITYSKGAGVLAMFERWLGEESFRAGIRRHVEEHRFGSADADDLLQALSAASGRDVSGPFQGFLTRPGVPFLRTREVCDSAGSRLVVEQSRYRPAGASGAGDEPWQVPACVRYAANGKTRESCSLISEPRAELALDPEACSDWVLPNADGAGTRGAWVGLPRAGSLLRSDSPSPTASWPRSGRACSVPMSCFPLNGRSHAIPGAASRRCPWACWTPCSRISRTTPRDPSPGRSPHPSTRRGSASSDSTRSRATTASGVCCAAG